MKNNELRTKGFSFKRFTIAGGQSGMPVSTDGVMLGAWAHLDSSGSVLDIGTGTGLLALMIAQRYAHINIQAIDIDIHAVEAAQHNFNQSPWPDRIALTHGDVLSLNDRELFDSIICNPPYFNNGEQSQKQQRATARHTDTLKHQLLIDQSFALTSITGTASFILPITEGEQFIALALKSGWFLSRRLDVQPTATKPISRVLFELAKQSQDTRYDQLTIRDKSGYSDQFIALTKDFYLKM